MLYLCLIEGHTKLPLLVVEENHIYHSRMSYMGLLTGQFLIKIWLFLILSLSFVYHASCGLPSKSHPQGQEDYRQQEELWPHLALGGGPVPTPCSSVGAPWWYDSKLDSYLGKGIPVDYHAPLCCSGWRKRHQGEISLCMLPYTA